MAVAPVNVFKAGSTEVAVGGQPVAAVFGGIAGGVLFNPNTPADQGISVPESLFYDFTAPATTYESATTFPLVPGQRLNLPAGLAVNLSVNAVTSGHKFSAIIWQPPPPYPPTPVPSTFPPSGPTGLTNVIKAYLYEEYADDADLQAMFGSFNAYAQEFIAWFNTINLPVYTSPTIVGPLLDWVALGLYGLLRPTLSSGQNKNLGAYNTALYNHIMWNGFKKVGNQNVTVTSDDIFKRIMTWRLYRGDGQTFNSEWLKRRILRFLGGVNGTDVVIQNTYSVSVTYPSRGQIDIVLPVDPNSSILKEAIDSGAVELPFQTSYSVTIAT